MFLQIDTIALAEDLLAQAEEPVQESINLWQMAQYGGWIMIILAILLAGACYIFIERLVVLKHATREDKSFMDRIRDYIHEGKIDSALHLCHHTHLGGGRSRNAHLPSNPCRGHRALGWGSVEPPRLCHADVVGVGLWLHFGFGSCRQTRH